MKMSVSSASIWQKNSRRKRSSACQCSSSARVTGVTSGQPSVPPLLHQLPDAVDVSALGFLLLARSSNSPGAAFFFGAAMGRK